MLLSGDIPPEPEAPEILLTPASEVAAIMGDGRIGQALALATSAARALDPPPTKLAVEADFTWIINEVDFGLKPPHPALPPIPATEAEQFHGSLAAAQSIVITTRPVAIGGVIKPGEGPDFYRIPIDRPHLRIGFQPGDPASRMADRFVVYDESGRIVGEWTMHPTGAGMTLELTGTDDQPGHEVYIAIGPLASDESSDVSESYVLLVEPIVQESPGVPPAPDNTETPAPAQGENESPVSQPPPAAPLPSESAPESPTTPALVADPAAIGQAGVGPLPLLAAAPFGGVLGGEAVIGPPETEALVFDLALAGLLMDPPGDDDPQASDPRDPLLRVSGEGALPLLVATLARPATGQLTPVEPSAPTDGTLLVERHLPPTDQVVPARDLPRRSALVRRTILPVGLGVLATLATTFHLAAPIAADRDSRHRRPLPTWLRRWLRERDGSR